MKNNILPCLLPHFERSEGLHPGVAEESALARGVVECDEVLLRHPAAPDVRRAVDEGADEVLRDRGQVGGGVPEPGEVELRAPLAVAPVDGAGSRPAEGGGRFKKIWFGFGFITGSCEKES